MSLVLHTNKLVSENRVGKLFAVLPSCSSTFCNGFQTTDNVAVSHRVVPTLASQNVD